MYKILTKKLKLVSLSGISANRAVFFSPKLFKSNSSFWTIDDKLSKLNLSNYQNTLTKNTFVFKIVDDKFVFKAIDNVVDALSSEFKNYSPDYILDTLQQNSMDIAKTYICLKEPLKNKTVGFTPLDDKVLLRKQGEEYKILLKEKGKDALNEREQFLSH